jgi:Cdc6-like AAA superfamily ATPase
VKPNFKPLEDDTLEGVKMLLPARFVDRERELEALREWCSRSRVTPLYIYGPEGSGKTRLLKEFTLRLKGYLGGDSIAVYINALEGESVENALLLSEPLQELSSIVASIVNRFAGLGLGGALATRLSSVLERIVGRARLKGNVVVVVDDVVQALGVDRVEWYVKWLHSLQWSVIENYSPKAFNVIVTTSEGVSLNRVLRHRHATMKMLWNLDWRAFRELYNQLSPPESLDYEIVWRTLGGNPGKLVELANIHNWSLESLVHHYRERLKHIVFRVGAEGLEELLEIALEDPDSISEAGDPRMVTLESILVENNLITPMMTSLGGRPEESLELGVGRNYSWQTPLYRDVLRELLKTRG